MTIAALPSNTLLSQQTAEEARNRLQQTNRGDSTDTSRLREQRPENQPSAQVRRAELEARLTELREQRELRLQASEEVSSRQSRSNGEEPALRAVAQQDRIRTAEESNRGISDSQVQQAIRTEERVPQEVEQRQERAADRTESVEERRARRIRESVESREVRQQENVQEAVQTREAQQAETAQRIAIEVRERARRLQDEAIEAQRREAERQQERLDAEYSEVTQLQSQSVNPATQQPDEFNVQPSSESDTTQTDSVDETEQERIFTQETDNNQITQTNEELIDILREEATIIETLLRQQEIGLTLSDQQLDAELIQVRDSLREEVERSARIQRNNLPATSRLGYFIDQVS